MGDEFTTTKNFGGKGQPAEEEVLAPVEAEIIEEDTDNKSEKGDKA